MNRLYPALSLAISALFIGCSETTKSSDPSSPVVSTVTGTTATPKKKIPAQRPASTPVVSTTSSVPVITTTSTPPVYTIPSTSTNSGSNLIPAKSVTIDEEPIVEIDSTPAITFAEEAPEPALNPVQPTSKKEKKKKKKNNYAGIITAQRFNEFDANSDGQLSPAELDILMMEHGNAPGEKKKSRKAANRFLKKNDKNNNGALDANEY